MFTSGSTSENRVLTSAWLLLVSATLLSWAAAEAGETAHVAGMVVLIVAAIKVGLVIHRFMEIGRGSRGWEWFSLVWVLGVSGMLVTTSALA
jgi:heme/copper-type cytochrome/quinol oxidase subunit 4